MKRRFAGLCFTILLASTAFAQPNTSEAKALIDQRKFADAILQLRATSQLYPRDAQTWYLLSKAYLGNNQADSAEIAGRKSLQYEDEDPLTYAVVSDALIRQQKFADAGQMLRDGLKERKNHPELLMQLGALQFAMDSLDAALRTYTLAREVEAANPKAYVGIGDVYNRQGVSPMAIQQYEKSLELDSNQLSVVQKLVDIHVKERQWNDAVRWLQFWTSKDPNDLVPQYRLGDIYYRAKVYGRAYNVFKGFVAKNAKDTVAVRMFVESAYNSRQWKDVTSWADKAVALDPSFGEAYRMKAHALFYQKEYQASVDAFQMVKTKDTMTADDFARMGKAYAELDKLEEAAVSYVEAVKLDSSMTSTMNDAGMMYMRLKKWDEAATMFEKRYTYDTSAQAVTAYINYAQCQLVLEKYDKAASALKIAIDRAPEYVPSYSRLGIAYLQMKEYGEARKTFERTIEVIDTNVTKYKDDLFSAYKFIGLSMMLDGSKRWGEAAKWVKKSLEVLPNDENALLLTAQALQNDNKIEESLKYYKLVLKVNPKNEQALEGVKTLEALLENE